LSLGNDLLGLLNHKPMTGYNLKKMLDRPMGFFWVAQMSQIYLELNKLEEEGLVKSEIEPQEKRPDRKVYQLTKEGRETFLYLKNEKKGVIKTKEIFLVIIRKGQINFT